MNIPEPAENAVREPPQIISTNTTVGDHPFKTAIFVKLYVPYATRPNIKPINIVFIILLSCMHG